MQNFEYYTPTRVLFGQDVENEVGRLAKEAGAGKVLVHFGGGSVQASGLLGRVYAALEAAGLSHVSLGGVQANPRLSLVRQGIQLCQQQGVNLLLAVGGGSVIDSAKAIGYGLANGGDVWDFFDGKRLPEKNMPLGVVLSIAAAGSEMSNSVVITNDESGNNEKRAYKHNILGRATFAVLNPLLTHSVPPYQTAVGCADILMHTMERYFTRESPSMGLTDAIAEALMRSVMENARILARQPQNPQARAEIMWASSLAHNGLTECGNGTGDWAVHQLGHELSGKYDVAHGASLTCMWGSWARYVYKSIPGRFAQFAQNVMELPPEGDDDAMALAGIEEMEGFFWGLELPTCMQELNVQPSTAELAEMAHKCSFYGKRTIGSVMVLKESDMLKIYEGAL